MSNQTVTKRRELEKAFRKQRGNCSICGLPMQLTKNQDDPFAATADHIIPKSFGGAIRGNIQAAHKVCNNKRGTDKMSNIDTERLREIVKKKHKPRMSQKKYMKLMQSFYKHEEQS